MVVVVVMFGVFLDGLSTEIERERTVSELRHDVVCMRCFLVRSKQSHALSRRYQPLPRRFGLVA